MTDKPTVSNKQPKCPPGGEWIKNMWSWESPGGPVVITPRFYGKGLGLIPRPWLGAKISQAVWHVTTPTKTNPKNKQKSPTEYVEYTHKSVQS